jgi:hypothetical protein
MIRVKLSTSQPEWPLLRQTPGAKGIWGNCQFFVDQQIEECDYWVVYDGFRRPERSLCPPENIIFVTAEPPAVKSYNERFLEQFSLVITCHRHIKHPQVIRTQQALPWIVGAKLVLGEGRFEVGNFTKDYDELKTLNHIAKDKLISVMCTTKTITEGHRKRLEYVEKLASYFGSRIDIFMGPGQVEDKWDTIARYKYHICLENSSLADYWTEKLSDAFLGLAYPFYYGCLNLADYFPKRSFTFIDINDFQKSVSIIEKAIENDQYNNLLESLKIAKNLVLDKYNLFAMLAGLCDGPPVYNRLHFPSEPKHVLLQPEHTFESRTSRILRWMISKCNSIRFL